MRKHHCLTGASLVLVQLLLGVTAGHAGNVGDAGALFLRLGMGARAAGMGEAYTAVAKDASSIYWNPGAMAPVLGTNIVLTHNEFIQSVRLEQGALTHATDFGTFGFSFTGLFMDDLDRFGPDPSEFPLGQFSVFDIAFAGGYARYVVPNLSIGISGKWIHQKIDQSTANGAAFDLGLYHISQVKGLKFAAVVVNLGSPMNYSDDFFQGKDFALPRSIKLGASYDRRLPGLESQVLAAFDIVLPNDGDAKQHLGGEFVYKRMLYLRAGYKAGYDSQGGTFGFGVEYQTLMFDYAFLLVKNDLGDSHRIGLTFKI